MAGPCLVFAQNEPSFACDIDSNELLANLTFCDKSLDGETRVKDLLNRLTLSEKISFLVTGAGNVSSLGIPIYQWWSEGLHGVGSSRGVNFTSLIPGATSFPAPIVIAASFNLSLFQFIAEVISTEARAMHNEGLAGLTYWTPNLNIFRDPRWGRGQETPGEDPLLTSKYGVAHVIGLQQSREDQPEKLKVAGCCKHYTAYDLDRWNGVLRYSFNAVVTEQDMEDTFQPPFESCVRDGKAASLMCSYNQVNGKPTCGDPKLLLGVVREKWNLKGYIVTDCDSLYKMYAIQNYTKTPEETVALGFRAGVDINCATFLGNYTQSAIDKGLVNVTDVDRALTNSFGTLMRLGFFDGNPRKQFYGNLGPKDVCTQENQDLARDAARQGIVLLKNSIASLPLSPTSISSLGVIGPNANATQSMLGDYAGIPCQYISPLQGLTTMVQTVYTQGCDSIACEEISTDEATKIASDSDAIVLVMGSDLSIEKEDLDRTNITLPGKQSVLVSEVAKAAKGPVILVILSGGGMDVTFAVDDPAITSIIWVGFPGEAGGAALADVIFGLHNPSGKLPVTWYPQSYVDGLPMTDMRMRPDPETGYPGRTYRFYSGLTVFNFGYGLSFTSFDHTVLIGPPGTIYLHPKGSLVCNSYQCEQTGVEQFSFDMQMQIKNTGNYSGCDTILIFSSPPPIHKAPQKHLLAFDKVCLLPGDDGLVMFTVNVTDLSIADEDGKKQILLGEYVLQLGEKSQTFNVTS
ncbi:unnamed protein product [Cuscuta epithymum]|nr:unnamed protein product [Cuscuta epithymum]CAH9144149.1 unnamed protein product [Cuscuta epithymum]